MKNRKGLYLLIGLVGTILIFFCILFFVHSNTLENGIQFTVSFEYDGAKGIEYNFYNQNGKLEKVEGQTKFLLEKTDYNTVKLMRKIIKKKQGTKTPSKKEGITIYNGQNKRYYLLPYQNSETEELISYIIDGYIRSEYKRVTGKDFGSELYIYQTDDEKSWTKNGSTDNIIHTIRCEKEDCKMIYVGKTEQDTVLFDGNYYYYNYETRNKKQLNIQEKVASANLVYFDNKIVGLELYNEKEKSAYYDLEKQRLLTEFEDYNHSVVTNEMLLKQSAEKTEEGNQYHLILWNTEEEKVIFNKTIDEIDPVKFSLSRINSEKNYYLLGKTKNEKTTYQLLNEKGEYLLEGKEVEQSENNELVIKGDKTDRYYNTSGEFLRETAKEKQ